MDSPPGTLFGREPAMILALVQAVLALFVAFGLSPGCAIVCGGDRLPRACCPPATA